MTDLQATISAAAAQVAETQASQASVPLVQADPTDAATTQAAVIAILGLLRAQGITSPT